MSSYVESSAVPLRLLLLEDDDADATLILARLEESGFNVRAERARGIEEFTAACRDNAVDLILADFRFPAGDGWQALEIARAFCPGVPFIFVSGAMGEDVAIESLKLGATDYVLKDRMTRLGPAVRRALAEREAQHELRVAEEALREKESDFRVIAENTRDLVCLLNADRTIRFASPSVSPLLGYEPREWLGRRVRDFMHPQEIDRFMQGVDRVVATGARQQPMLVRFRHKEGQHVWFEMLVDPIFGAAGEVVQFVSVARDSTERRRTEETLRRGEQLFEGIAEANRLLLTADRVLDSLPAVLEALGRAVGADRVFVLEARPEARPVEPSAALRAEWVREPAYSVLNDPKLVDFPFAQLSMEDWIAAGALRDETDVAANRAAPRLSRVLQERGLVSPLAFAIVVVGRTWGCVVFDQCSTARVWTVTERSALALVASSIGEAIAREQTLAALAESERRYEALLAGLSEAIFQIDLEARWRFLNPTWETLTGYFADECLGRRFSEFLDPTDAAVALEGFGRLLSGRDTRTETEIRFRHRNGREIFFRVTAQTQLDERGRTIGVSGTLIDVTQRRLAQEALRASERKFAAVFASTSDALFLFDSATNLVVECNPRAVEMFEAVSAMELVGLNSDSLLRRPPTPAEAERGRSQLERGEGWTREVECLTRRGRAFWGLLTAVRMAPEALGTTLVRVTDITELKRSEERMRASLAEKEVLLKEVYHRVKNNLQIVSALLRMQTRRVKDKRALAALENAISRVMAMSMVHEKLYQAQNLVSIDFLSFAQSLVGFLNQLTVGGQAPVTVRVKGEPLALSIDQAIPLGLVLNELVTNSLKYAFPKGRAGRVDINVAADERAHVARVTVSDDGVGPGEGVDLENSAGLGLRIVRMLVEQLQGTLEIDPRGGLRVTVRFPLPAARAREPAQV